MAETYEVQALEKISTEVDESQIKVILSTQCIKAQTFLVNKLRNQAERSKEACSFISNANHKLQAEITHAQQEMKSLLIAQETIKMANVELKKEWLLAKEKKIEVIERVKNGEKKYEDLWKESKARYESIPFVQKLLKAKEEVLNLEQQITKLENDEKELNSEIEMKKETSLGLDRKRIIELAEFIVNEMPKSIDLIKEKSAALSNLTNELEKLDLNAKANMETKQTTPPGQTKDIRKADNDWNSEQNDSLFMPKLQLSYLDFDILSEKLDQVKLKKVDQFNKMPENINVNSVPFMEITASDVKRNYVNTEEYISSFFNKPSTYEEYKPQNYAKMKLINILEDININVNEAQKLMEKVNPVMLQPVDSISADDKNTDEACFTNNDKKIDSDTIEEINLTPSFKENLLVPPTQFLDKTSEMQILQKEQQEKEIVPASTTKPSETQNLSQAFKSSQEEFDKKKVSFDLSNTLEMAVVSETEKPEIAEDIGLNKTLNSQLDVSVVSDDGFAQMKEMVMKKHNLDLSPQFVYSKNIMNPLKFQNSEGGVVTSKFFQYDHKVSKAEPEMKEKITIGDDHIMEDNEIAANPYSEIKTTNQTVMDKNITVEMDEDNDIVSSPKRQKMNEMPQSDKHGFLFSHGPQIISDSLDVSISTTGFEDGDADFPHCIDSSLLLSPKADLPMSGTGEEVLSQDVPNFLTGLRKTGLSFFGRLPSSKSNTDPAQNQGSSSFSFNFGGDEKKSRGGLFSMFQ